MSEQYINIKIDPDGTIRIDMEGYKGNACDADLQKLSKLLGQPVGSNHKPDYYEAVNEEFQKEI